MTKPDTTWVTEAISIKAYDTAWPATASTLIEELKTLYPFNTAFEHIGSTAVPGLSAKPVIDLMTPVKSFDDLNSITQALKVNNWNLIEPDKSCSRIAFVKVMNNTRLAHFHLVLKDSGELERHIAFREILRNNPLILIQYATLKETLVQKFKNDREGYTKAKAYFIQSVLSEFISEGNG